MDSKYRRSTNRQTPIGLIRLILFFFLQHASAEVERMLIGNKCDMQDKRQVSREKGEHVSMVIFETKEKVFSTSWRWNMELNSRKQVPKEIS